MKEDIFNKRKAAWRGYNRFVDFQEFLKDNEFPEVGKDALLDFLIYLDLFNVKNKYVNYMKLFRDMIFRKSMIDQRINKFEYKNYKDKKPRVREFNDKTDRTIFIQQKQRDYR